MLRKMCLSLAMTTLILPVNFAQINPVKASKDSRAQASTVNPFTVGERLNYEVSWSDFIVAGELTLETKERRNFDGVDAFHVSAEAQSVGLVSAAVIKVNDIYESFQSTLKRRFSNGFTMQMAYTFSHDISQTTSILIPQYRDRARYTTSLDRTHALVISASYELPFGNGKQYVKSGIGAAILGGWTLNGLFTHYSGSPFSVTASAASCNCPGNSQVANQVLPDVAIVGDGLNGRPYFNPLAYAPVTNVAFGNSGFNSLRGPGSTNQDLNIFRDFKLTERFKLQIRGEALNMSNTPHFSNPGSNVSNYVSPTNLGGFSQITSTNPLGRITDARYFRFGLRVMF